MGVDNQLKNQVSVELGALISKALCGDYKTIMCNLHMDSFLVIFFFFLNLFIKPSSRIHMFFQMRRCDI